MKLGANKWVGLVVVSLTALLTGCGAVTATPMPNQPTNAPSERVPNSAASAPNAARDGVEPARRHT